MGKEALKRLFEKIYFGLSMQIRDALNANTWYSPFRIKNGMQLLPEIFQNQTIISKPIMYESLLHFLILKIITTKFPHEKSSVSKNQNVRELSLIINHSQSQ